MAVFFAPLKNLSEVCRHSCLHKNKSQLLYYLHKFDVLLN